MIVNSEPDVFSSIISSEDTAPATAGLEERKLLLEKIIQGAGRLLVAYSGGVDSGYLAYAAHRVLGDQMLAVIADSPSLSRTHLHDAIQFAEDQGIPLHVAKTNEMESADYVRNDSMRCFHCKDELFSVLDKMCADLNFTTVAYGMNLNDVGDFRPGQKAAREHHVSAPLADASLTKQDIRLLAQQAGLQVWDKPASACLSSRVAYGTPVTIETLSTIEQGEEFLLSLGLRQMRVRHHGDTVRLEISRDELQKVLSIEVFDQISARFKALGYKYVTLDLEGYRSGSMNAVLPVSAIQSANS
jgi:uncharacterized protein